MVKRKVTEDEAKVEVPKAAAKPKAPAKKAAKAASPAKQSPPAKKTKAPAAAKATKAATAATPAKKAPAKKTVNNNVADKAAPEAKPKGRAKKAEAPAAESPVKAKKPAKTVAKETTAAAKAVKVPKPKPSPAKAVGKATAAKATKVPKVATPKKAAAPASRARKANAGKEEPMATEVQQGEEAAPAAAAGSSKGAETGDSRKRAKPAKEVVAAKKPKLEVVIPFRQTRGPGVVLTMGQGDVGQIGLGPDVLEKSRPALVEKLSDVVDAVAGGMHTVCLTAQGEIYTFGCNDEGALGRDTSQEGSEFEPGRVHLPGKAKLISAGDSHSAALLEDGRVFIWGTFRDSHGPMGLNTAGSQKLPVPIMEGIPVTQIASGADHFVCLTAEGQVYTCGCAEQGQLGRVPELFSDRGGRKGTDYLLTPQPVALSKGGKKPVVVDSVWTGSYATFVRARDTGLIYVFGLNNYNQLGLASSSTRFHPEISAGFKGHKWKSISCGQHHTVALDEDGKVYCLGRKEYGRLGMGEIEADLAVPTLVPALESTKCVEVAAGESVTLAVTENGTAYSWGMGSNGQLGHGDEEDALEPLAVKGKQVESRQVLVASAGGQHTVLLAADKDATAAPTPAQ